MSSQIKHRNQRQKQENLCNLSANFYQKNLLLYKQKILTPLPQKGTRQFGPQLFPALHVSHVRLLFSCQPQNVLGVVAVLHTSQHKHLVLSQSLLVYFLRGRRWTLPEKFIKLCSCSSKKIDFLRVVFLAETKFCTNLGAAWNFPRLESVT